MKRFIQPRFVLFILLLGSCFRLSAQTTQMTIIMNNGSEKSYIMEESDRVFFKENTSLVIQQSANTDMFNLADIRKIVCSETVGQAENQTDPVCITPNPVHDVMTLHHLDDPQTVYIYSIDGRLMKSFEASEGQSISTESLPMGMYLVKTQTCVLKMMKL